MLTGDQENPVLPEIHLEGLNLRLQTKIEKQKEPPKTLAEKSSKNEDHELVVMSMAQLRAVKLLSQAIIRASHANKSAPSSELLRVAQAMSQVA